MNYEKGLSRLRECLVKNADSMALDQLDSLERRLHDSLARLDSHPIDDIAFTMRSRTLVELDRLSWRTVAVAFADLCNPSSKVRSRFAISIKGMMLLVLAIVVLPAVSIAAAANVRGQSQIHQVNEIREEIQDIDERINQEVSSPYYLSPIPEDPCSEATLSKIVKRDNFKINVFYLGMEPALCVWEYRDLNLDEVIAKDVWGDTSRPLITREYYRDGVPIAQDNFDINRYNCVKERLYFIDGGLPECYSETGRLLSIDPQQSLISPIPPMVYWFFYR